MSSKLSCICTSPPPSASLLQCVCCHQTMHLQCYNPSPSSVFSEESSFLCIICRLFLSNPFYQITDLIVKPYIIAEKQHIEQFLKFELTFAQRNDLTKGFRTLFFLCTKLNTRNSSNFYEWPEENCFFWINGKALDFNRGFYAEIPQKLMRNCNEFSLCCLEGFDQPYVFLVFMAKRQNIKEISLLITQRTLLGIFLLESNL